MCRASEILHKPVIVGSSGDCVGHVTNLVFDERQGVCLGAIVERGMLIRRTRLLPFADIVSISTHFLVARRHKSLIKPHELSVIAEHPVPVPMKQKPLVSTDGRRLGRIVDVHIDEDRGRIEGYELTRGRLAALLRKRTFIPISDGVVAGNDVVVVPNEAADALQSALPGNESQSRPRSAGV